LDVRITATFSAIITVTFSVIITVTFNVINTVTIILNISVTPTVTYRDAEGQIFGSQDFVQNAYKLQQQK
jgi:hypothetical protein